MSLVPYSSRESREIVLRHDDAIVVRDPHTRELALRSVSPELALNDCPTCHRPLRTPSPERQQPSHASAHSNTFISPEYFRMLQTVNSASDENNPPSSPIRRLVEPALTTGGSSVAESENSVEFVASTPAVAGRSSIKKEAFSPNYFKRFFIEEKELGRGGKGVVLLVRHELDRVSLGQFACKRVPVGDDHAWLEKVLIEVQLLQGLSHPNLVSYRHVWLEDVQLNRFGPSVPCAFILQQYCNSGDLLHYIVGSTSTPLSTKEQLKEQMRRRSKGTAERPDLSSKQRKLAFEEIYSFFKDITSGLAHLHAANYIHRDLKPSNCLLHQDGSDMRCLISDFGEVQAENVVRKSTGSTGTISYCAPEVLKQDQFGHYGNFTTKSDIFSLGMILYFMCFGRLPYKSADSFHEDFEDMDLLRAEISRWSGFHDERRERPELPNQLYNFLKRLLALDPNERPSAADILEAIRSERGLQNPQRLRPNSTSAIRGRIQAIDSPVPPSTPVHEREPKRVRSMAYIEDAQLTIEVARHRPSNSIPKTTITTPLLMPPPTTRFSALMNRVSLYHHYTESWVRLNEQTLSLFARTFIFLVKVFVISKPCLSSIARQMVWYPLVILAAVELGLGAKTRWRLTGVLFMMHFLVAGLFNYLGPGLCDRRLAFA
ncbi:calcium-dependent kinase protein [Rutstroemia sp. NJR-2017a BBW]|nr:calcium-dependent kinase protein [Rutstroemia sp. NJR-2017a BBW]